jgi:hypothetical protein
MVKVTEPAPVEPEAEANCNHYWIIESPNGPTSWGVCKYCGKRKEFKNYLPYPSWDEGRSQSVELSDPTGHKSDWKSGA